MKEHYVVCVENKRTLQNSVQKKTGSDSTNEQTSIRFCKFGFLLITLKVLFVGATQAALFYTVAVKLHCDW